MLSTFVKQLNTHISKHNHKCKKVTPRKNHSTEPLMTQDYLTLMIYTVNLTTIYHLLSMHAFHATYYMRFLPIREQPYYWFFRPLVPPIFVLGNKSISISISKTSDHIQIKIKMPNPSQEPPASSKSQNKDLKDMDALCIFKIKIDSHNSKTWVHQLLMTISKSRSRY